MGWVPVIDVSRHQGAIDFGLMRQRGVELIILRASHGNVIDDRLIGYYHDARRAGYAPHQIAFYSFINPKRGSGPATAAATAGFIRRATDGDTDVTYMLDVENYRNEPPDVGQSPVAGPAFTRYLRDHMAAFRAAMPGCRITAYSNRAYWNSVLGPNDAKLASELEWLVPRYPLYSSVAYEARGYPPEPWRWDEYAFSLASGPTIPTGAGGWEGWQFSAGFNRQGMRYGCQSSDLDLCIFDEAAAGRWFPAPVVQPPDPLPIPIPPPDPIPTLEADVYTPHDGVRIMQTTVPANIRQRVAAAPNTPGNATGVGVNITFTGSLAAGFATLWSGDGPHPPGVSQISFKPGNQITSPASGFTIVRAVDGAFFIQANVEVSLILDQVGYTTPPVAGPAGPPGQQGQPGVGADPAFIVSAVTAKLLA